MPKTKKTTKRKQYLYRKTAKGEFVYVGTVSGSVKAKKVYSKRKKAKRGRGLARTNPRRGFGFANR